MDTKIKNYLHIAISISVLMAALSLWVFVRSYSQSIEPSSFRSFSVTAEGEAVAVPDIAAFSFSVITQGDKNLGLLQKENTEKVNQAISFIKSNRVDAKDIKTASYNLEPRYQYFSCPRIGGPCPPPEIVGYTVTQTVSVKVRDFSKIGDILAGVVGEGANSVSSLSFTVDDPTELENQARTEAIQKGKDKALVIARAGGFGIGRLLSIDEGGGYYPKTYYAAAPMAERGGGDVVAPTIEPGSQEIKVNVVLRYEIR
ncbi:SIMPL domain-containing protein [Candidatus Jorgensenbacteria bacterium]|nr:SIMPL domain-containing protein [Candidatus Jorgensenbacteria bacterium]